MVPPLKTTSITSPRRREGLIEFEEFISLPKMVFKLIGFDFLQMSPKSRWLQNILNAYLACSIGSHLYCKYYFIKQLWLFVRKGDIPNFITLTPYVFFAMDSSIKFVAIVVNMKRLRAIYHALEEVYPQTVLERCIYQVDRHYLPKWVRYIVYCYLTACGILIYCPLLTSIGLYVYDTITLDDEAHFAYLKLFPIPYDFFYHSFWRYSLVSAVEILNGNISTAVTVGADLLLICYTAQICMHLDAIGRMLEHYEPSVENVEKDCEFLAQLVRRHQVMFSIHNEINASFGVGLLCSLMNTTIVLCTIAAQLIIEDLGLEFLKYLIFLITAAGQFYLVCYYGQLLINTNCRNEVIQLRNQTGHFVPISQHIAAAAFSQKWFNGSNAYKQRLLLIILRSQKRAELSARGFQPISLDTFKIVMTMTYRFFALIKSVLQ